VATKLLRVGGRLAVLGIEAGPGDTVGDATRWHVMSPGTWSVPQLGGAGNAGLTVGRTLCGRHAFSNGYAADFKPLDGALCAACEERS
jgi:hypothetical protein